jgi:hypothetical protein
VSAAVSRDNEDMGCDQAPEFRGGGVPFLAMAEAILVLAECKLVAYCQILESQNSARWQTSGRFAFLETASRRML